MGEIMQSDKELAAVFYAAQAFGKSKAEILADWQALEDREEGYCHPLWLQFAKARDDERRAIVEWLRNTTGRWPRSTSHADMLGDAIERGEHLKAQEKQR